MTPSRPYLIRAIYEWLNDNNKTPHVMVDASVVGVEVPQSYVQAGRIVLNISPNAIKDLFISNEDLSFSARFNGMPTHIVVPMQAVLAIYARENGQGMFFDESEDFSRSEESQDDEPTPPPSAPSGGKRATLRVVK